MKYLITTLAAGLVLTGVGGCSTPSSVCVTHTYIDQPAFTIWSSQPQGGFMLGAGDELGQQMFTVYVASLRQHDESVYVLGADDAPQSE
jgi:hypothetical protein